MPRSSGAIGVHAPLPHLPLAPGNKDDHVPVAADWQVARRPRPSHKGLGKRAAGHRPKFKEVDAQADYVATLEVKFLESGWCDVVSSFLGLEYQ